jgi:hypothetical protein
MLGKNPMLLKILPQKFKRNLRKLFFLSDNFDEINHTINNFYNVLNYKKYIPNNRNKVIYTCFTGSYDNLIQHFYINYDYDYVCFTDNECLLHNENALDHDWGIWKIRKLQYNDCDYTKIARWHKTHPHVL